MKIIGALMFLVFIPNAYAGGYCPDGYVLSSNQMPNTCIPASNVPTVTLPTVTVTATRLPSFSPQLQSFSIGMPSPSMPEINFPSGNPTAPEPAASQPPQSTSSPYTNNGGSQQQPQQQSTGESCQQAQDVAYKCCTDPSSCLLNAGGPSDASGVTTSLIQMVLGATTSLPGDISAMCGRMKDVSYASTALSAYLIRQCHAAVAHCDDLCNGNRNDMAVCDKYSGSESALAGQALAAQFSNVMATKCQNATQVQNSFDNPDCSTAAAASTPFCQYKCNRPGAQADPTCAGIIAAMQNNSMNSGLGINNNSGAATSGFPGLPPTPAEPPQQAPCVAGSAAPCGGSPQQAALAQPMNPNMMPQGPTLPMDGGMGGPDNGAQGATPQQGWNADILRGIASGNGYSSAPMMTGGGGGGYSSSYNSQGQHLNPFGQPFNLRDFLPGGKLANNKPRLNVFRGLASQYADINPRSRDIFQEISDRYYAVCLRHMLYNCDSLIKYHNQKRHFTGLGAAAKLGQN